MITKENITIILDKIKTSTPLIHNITNIVVSQFTANILLSLGASPAMVNAEEEIEEFTKKSNALVINLGTIHHDQAKAMILACQTAQQNLIPWVLDPVGVGAISYRSNIALQLLKHHPQAIRGNASEIIGLNRHRLQQPFFGGRGVDSINTPEDALSAAKELALTYQTTISISGQTDYITDGKQTIAVHNGHMIMTKITGSGCAATAITAACLAVESNALLACSAAMAILGIAGENAAKKAPMPGNFQMALLDEIYLLNTEAILQHCKLNNI